MKASLLPNGTSSINGTYHACTCTSINSLTDSSPEDRLNDAGTPSAALEDGVDSLEPIAIIGMSLKFPQDATSPESLWRMLMEGRSAMTEIPKDRFNIEAFYDRSNKPGLVGCASGSKLDMCGDS